MSKFFSYASKPSITYVCLRSLYDSRVAIRKEIIQKRGKSWHIVTAVKWKYNRWSETEYCYQGTESMLYTDWILTFMVMWSCPPPWLTGVDLSKETEVLLSVVFVISSSIEYSLDYKWAMRDLCTYMKLNWDANCYFPVGRRGYTFRIVRIQTEFSKKKGVICSNWNADYLLDFYRRNHVQEILPRTLASWLCRCHCSCYWSQSIPSQNWVLRAK